MQMHFYLKYPGAEGGAAICGPQTWILQVHRTVLITEDWRGGDIGFFNAIPPFLAKTEGGEFFFKAEWGSKNFLI